MALPAPDGLRLDGDDEAARGPEHLLLTWDEVEDADSYDLRLTLGGVEDVRVGATPGARAEELRPNGTYAVAVRAVAAGGPPSDWSAPITACCRPRVPDAPGFVLDGLSGNTGRLIAWSADGGGHEDPGSLRIEVGKLAGGGLTALPGEHPLVGLFRDMEGVTGTYAVRRRAANPAAPGGVNSSAWSDTLTASKIDLAGADVLGRERVRSQALAMMRPYGGVSG